MPDDSERQDNSPESSLVNQDMGLNDGLFDSSGAAKSSPYTISAGFDSKNESFATSSPGSSTAITGVKLEPHTTIDSVIDSIATTSWMANQFSSAGSRVPFTKREKEFLCCLIQKHVYLKMGQTQTNLPTLGVFNQKNSISSFCRVPNAAWKAISIEYNSKDNVRQRSIKQLRKCWENLKHRGNIDPAALYSGKKLQGKTSLSGAFTLTAEGEENATMALPAAKVSGGFIETSMEEDDTGTGIESSSPSRELLPTDLSMRRRITNEPCPTPSDDNRFPSPYDTTTNARHANEETVPPQHSHSATPLLPAPLSSSIASQRTSFTAARSRAQPIITNVRTVRSLKPSLTQLTRRRLGVDYLSKSRNARPLLNYSMITKANSQKIQEMKLKLISARIKEHESNIQRMRLQMEHAQAQHDVHMRLLRTKAAWYDAHLRKLEAQLDSGDLTSVGEDEENYHGDNPDVIAMQYEQDCEEYT